MKLVSQRIYFKNWIFMIRDVTVGNTSCNLSRNLSRGFPLFSHSEFLVVEQQKYRETICKRDVTLCNG